MLLGAALRVVAREGVAAATTRRIAAEAGVATGVVHYAYRSKDELLRDVALAATQQLSDAAVAGLKPGGDLRATLRATLRDVWRMVEDDPDTQLALYELTTYCLRTPGLADVATEQYVSYTAVAAATLEAVAAACDVTFDADRQLLARLLGTVIDGGMLAWLADRDTAAAIAAIDLFIEHLVSIARPATGTIIMRAQDHV
jgi:AcrR family transcriptional regulator